MAVELSVTKNIDDKYVQVEAKRARAGASYYRVPKEKADEFCAYYKKFDKKNNRISDLSFFSSVIIGSLAANFLTRNWANIPRTITTVSTALGFGYISDIIAKKSLSKQQQEILANFNAQEINLESAPKIADLIK